MFLPRYSLRTILYLAVAVAIVAVVAGQAVRGALWAIALTIGIGSLGVSWFVLVVFYAIVAAFARVALTPEFQQPLPAYYPEIHPDEPASAAGQQGQSESEAP
ncbi:MAG: hypothetical protein ACR2NU_13820 [Aeoliella sp.]